MSRWFSDFLLITLTIQTHLNIPTLTQETKQEWTFKDYIARFDPKNVYDKIKKREEMLGVPLTNESYFDAMFHGTDIASDLLHLKVTNGDTRIMTPLDKDARRWQPYKGMNSETKTQDTFFLRPRLYELMKQVIYQARNKMIIMQRYRKKYNKSPLYKMGYLFGKTDNAVQVFSRYANRFFIACSYLRQGILPVMTTFEMLVLEERLLALWFNVELLTDLIEKNDNECRKVINESQYDVPKRWKFID